jgi:hypothetical protein
MHFPRATRGNAKTYSELIKNHVAMSLGRVHQSAEDVNSECLRRVPLPRLGFAIFVAMPREDISRFDRRPREGKNVLPDEVQGESVLRHFGSG